MKVKTSELEGAALDWAVAIAMGMSPVAAGGDGFAMVMKSLGDPLEFRPSSDWRQGGPLIAEKITVLIDCETGCYADSWAKAGIYGQPFSEYDGQGSTLLVAAMRAIVTSEIGDEVDIPNELAEGM